LESKPSKSKASKSKYLLLSCRKYNDKLILFRLASAQNVYQAIDVGNIFNHAQYEPLFKYFNPNAMQSAKNNLEAQFINEIGVKYLDNLNREYPTQKYGWSLYNCIV